MSKKEKLDLIRDDRYYQTYDVDKNNNEYKNLYLDGYKLKYQKEFRSYLEDYCIEKPNKNSTFASQGLCHAGKYILTTSYDNSDTSSNLHPLFERVMEVAGFEDYDKVSENSRLDIVDTEGRFKTLYFDNRAHVGGIAYHEGTGQIFVSNEGKINVYSEETIANARNNDIIKPEADKCFEITKEVLQSSYIAVHNDDFYVGRWLNGETGAKLAKYEIDPETGKTSEEPTIYTVPYSDVQGMEVYEKNGKEYFIFSSTDGFAKSELYVAELKDGKFETVGSMSAPPLLEQISINQDGKLGMVFETDCKKYDMMPIQIDNVLYMDIDKAIDNMEKDKKLAIDKFGNKLDFDKDGKIETDEYNKFANLFVEKESLLEKHLKWLNTKTDEVLDVNNDGKINFGDVGSAFVNTGKKAFDILDVNDDGKIGFKDVGQAVVNLGKGVHNALDVNNDGELGFSDITSFGSKVHNVLDTNDDGKLSFKDVTKAADTLSKKVNNVLDFDRDGKNEIQEGIEYIGKKANEAKDYVEDKIDDIKEGIKDKWNDVMDFFD